MKGGFFGYGYPPLPRYNCIHTNGFPFYNNKHLFKQGIISRSLYLSQLSDMQDRSPGLASQCTACGKCLEHCPQEIDIPNEMKRVEK